MQDYLNEVVDLKRFALLNKKRIWMVIVGALLGTALFGGIYYIKSVVLKGPDVYRCKSMYYITFDTEEFEAVHDYYNDYTWNVVLDSDQIMGKAATAIGEDKQYMAEISVIPTMSDIRMIWVYFDHEDATVAEKMQRAVAEALYDFASQTEGFTSIELWDGPIIEKVEVPIFIGRNLIFGAVVGAIFGFLMLLYMSAKDSSIYTFEDFDNRFSKYPIGMIFKNGRNYSDGMLADNLQKLLTGNKIKELNVFGSEALSDASEVPFDYEAFSKLIPGDVRVNYLVHTDTADFYEKVRSDIANIMLVRCGADDFGSLSRAINNAKLMDIEIVAYILVDGDEKLYNSYYSYNHSGNETNNHSNKVGK